MRIDLDLMCGLLLIMVALVPAAGVLADEQGPESEVRDTRTQKDEPPSERRASAPATSFTPTEKIKADSSVAFPVDI